MDNEYINYKEPSTLSVGARNVPSKIVVLLCCWFRSSRRTGNRAFNIQRGSSKDAHLLEDLAKARLAFGRSSRRKVPSIGAGSRNLFHFVVEIGTVFPGGFHVAQRELVRFLLAVCVDLYVRLSQELVVRLSITRVQLTILFVQDGGDRFGLVVLPPNGACTGAVLQTSKRLTIGFFNVFALHQFAYERNKCLFDLFILAAFVPSLLDFDIRQIIDVGNGVNFVFGECKTETTLWRAMVGARGRFGGRVFLKHGSVVVRWHVFGLDFEVEREGGEEKYRREMTRDTRRRARPAEGTVFCEPSFLGAIWSTRRLNILSYYDLQGKCVRFDI